jgi:hypothetical protein
VRLDRDFRTAGRYIGRRAMRARSPLAVLVVASLGCSAQRTTSPVPESKLKVRDIEVGRSVGTDKLVTAPEGAFGPADTIYTSVVTEGTARATLSARWTYQGAVLEETQQRIAPAGKAVSEFHVFNPAGWAPGEYRVEILLDGHVVGDRAFRVDVTS